MSNSQLDFGLDLDYDKDNQEGTEFQESLKIYKLKNAKRFKIIKYSLFILQLVKVIILWSILYWEFISKLTFKRSDIKTVFNLPMSKKIDTALLGIFVLIIDHFILLCLLLLSTPFANFIKTLIKEYKNGYFTSSLLDGPLGYNG